MELNALVKWRGRSDLARKAGWLSLGQGVSILSQSLYFLFLAKLLGPIECGVYAGAFALTALVSQYSSLGTGTVLMRHASGRAERFPVYWGNTLVVTSSVSMVSIIVLQTLGTCLLNASSASLVTIAAIANCFFAQITIECGHVFQTFERMKLTAAVSLLTNLARTLACGVVFFKMHHASARQWAIVATVVSGLAAGLSLVLVTVKFGYPKFDLKLALKRGGEGLGYAFAVSSSSVYNDIDKVMLSHYGMNLANGIYTMAYRALDAACIPLSSLRDAALPRLFKIGRFGIGDSGDLALRIIKRSLPLAGVLGALMFGLAPLVPRLVGREFTESVRAIQWLCFIPIFRSVHQMCGSALTGSGKQAQRTLAQIGVAILNLLLNLYFIPAFGWRGAAGSSLVCDGCLAIVCWALLYRAIGTAKSRERYMATRQLSRPASERALLS